MTSKYPSPNNDTAMKHFLIALLASAAVVAGGCSKDESPASADGYGTLRILCSPDAAITTRAEIATSPVPEAGEFALRITGTDYDRSWTSVAEFNEAQPLLPTGEYTAEVSFGDPAAEGAGKPCYHGTKTFQILPRKSISEQIEARIVNSQVTVTSTEAFRTYFHDAVFTVTTSAGNRFTFKPGAETQDEAVFVEAGTRLTLTGEAMLQSQTGTAFDRPYTFPEQTLEQTVARTRHTFCFDARDNGSATVTINLYDEYLDERTFEVELNDDSQKDPNA